MPWYFFQQRFQISLQQFLGIFLLQKTLITQLQLRFLYNSAETFNSDQLITDRTLKKGRIDTLLPPYSYFGFPNQTLKQATFAISLFLLLPDQTNSLLLLFVVSTFACIDHGIQLGYHDGTFRNSPKFPSSKLINKMTESIIIFLLALCLLNRQLQLTLHFPVEKIIDHNVIGRII